MGRKCSGHLSRRWRCTIPDLVSIGRHVPRVVEGAGSELGTDVGRQSVQKQQQEHGVRLVTGRKQRQQLVHQCGGPDASDVRKSQQLPRQLPTSWGVRLQQAVFYELVGVGGGVDKAVVDVTDVVENIGRELGEDIVPLVLRRDDMGPPEDGIRLLEPPFGLFRVKRR